MWKDFFYFSKSDRRAIIILILLITATIVIKWRVRENRDEELDLSSLNREYLSSIGDSLCSAAKWPENRSYNNPEPVVLDFFDPNKADSIELIRLGLPPKVVRNIIKYRISGGVFVEPGDMAKIYGLSEDLFSHIEYYIKIEANSSRKSSPDSILIPIKRSEFEQTKEFTPSKLYPKVKKISKGEVVDINDADTSALMTIPGIGAGYAQMIINYRKKLGGFVNTEQLLEIENLPDSLLEWFVVIDTVTTPIYINRATVQQLRSHPYLNFYQARVIVEHRNQNGKIKSLVQLSLYNEFTGQDLERLSPYICYD